jgi:hypothetical protein
MEKTSYDAAAFVEAWKQVWSSVTCLPNFRRDMVGRVFVDILNEPDSQWQAWQPKDGKAGAWPGCGHQRCTGCGLEADMTGRHLSIIIVPGRRVLQLSLLLCMHAVLYPTARQRSLCSTGNPQELLCVPPCVAAGMTELYLGVMDALWAMTPGAPVFFINGGGQGAYAVSQMLLQPCKAGHAPGAACPVCHNNVCASVCS